MLRFEYPDFLWLLVLIPVLIIAFIMIRKWRLKTLGKYGNLNLISGLAPETSNVKPAVKFMLLMLALGTLLLGLADLQVGTKLAVAKKQGQDIIVAIDVSNSMLAKDSPSESAPTRLELAKFAVSKLIDKLKGDQIGFIVFAGEAAVHMPLTSDYSAARLFLSTVDPELIPVQCPHVLG